MIRPLKRFLWSFLLISVVVAAWAAESSQPRKAAFLDEKELAFIRPGLVFTIEQAWVEGDGTLKYRFSVTDPKGAPLDLNGVFTPGAIAVRSIVAYIPAGDTLYRSYNTRQVTSPGGGSAEQATTDSGGSLQKIGDGVYIYTFGTKLPSGYQTDLTHTVAAWATRDLSEFELGTDLDAATFNWAPSGLEVTVVRNVVSDQKCNQCHGELVAHGSRTEVELCVVCHTPQSTDPDSGNTVDMTTMVHKIHMGEALPSVQAGEPYRIIGFQQQVHDYSNVVYPADVRNCQTCHLETSGEAAALSPRQSQSLRGRVSTLSMRGRSRTLAQAEARGLTLTSNQHLLRPSRRACGSCHDDVNFATGENHAGLPQVSDTQCARCHTPEGELEFDLSIKGAHTIPRFSKELSGVNFELFGVTNAGPGQTLTVEFGIADDAGQPIAPSAMARLALVLAGNDGPNADFSQVISANATAATGQGGRYLYTFSQALPADASGSWAVGIEGYKNATILPGTLQERTVSDAGENKVLHFSVTGGAPTPRREVVATERCNSCHFSLNLHGDYRNSVEQCVLCHNPSATDAARRPADQGPPESVNFKEMIHRIHTGEEFSRELTIFGFGGTPHNYNEVRYPRERTDCAACHLDGSQLLPLPGNLASTVDPRGLINPAPPVTGACLSCHDNLPAAAHADLATSPTYGESCDVCHGQGAEFAVDKLHAR
jgi:hypothetical protein